jgi:striatin 1/3/4
MSRETSTQPLFSPSTSLLSAAAYSGNEVLSPAPDNYRSIADESSAEKFLEQYRLYGHQYSSRQDDARHHQPMQDSRDAFMFGDAPVIPDDQPQTSRPDKDQFPEMAVRRLPGAYIAPHRRKSSGSNVIDRRRSQEPDTRDITAQGLKDPGEFKLRFALNGHLDVVRSVIFTGGGSPSEPEICSAGDDGMIKRWIIPASYTNVGPHGPSDLDINSYFTHRGHEGTVTCLAAAPVTASFSTGGRASGDGWIFSGGQDATVRVWERGRVDPKATLHGHTDAVWSLCVLPGTCGSVFGPDCNSIGPADRILLASGSADGTVRIWAVSAPPHLSSPQAGSRRGVGGSRRHSVTSGSNYPSSPQPTTASQTAFRYTCVHTISRIPSPTCISPLSPGGENFVVSYNDSTIVIFDTRTAEEIICMASQETYDGTPATGINAVVATALGLEGGDIGRGMLDDENVVHGATGSMGLGGVEGVVISGHEDQFIRFFDANSGKSFPSRLTVLTLAGQCTYSMLAHPSAISALSLSKDGREVVSAGHDASIRFWSLEKRMCTQEITSHRVMFGEGVCSVVWSQDGRFVVSGGGDSSVKVFAR